MASKPQELHNQDECAASKALSGSEQTRVIYLKLKVMTVYTQNHIDILIPNCKDITRDKISNNIDATVIEASNLISSLNLVTNPIVHLRTYIRFLDIH